MLYAFVTSTNKIGSTLSVGVAYVILPLFGFVAKEGIVNTPEAIWGLKACYLLPPVICVLIGGPRHVGLQARRETPCRDPPGAVGAGCDRRRA